MSSSSSYAPAACAYGLSVVLDELDGRAARLCGQCTKFGALLDMLTDRRVRRESGFRPAASFLSVYLHSISLRTSMLMLFGFFFFSYDFRVSYAYAKEHMPTYLMMRFNVTLGSGTTALLMRLCVLYPRWTALFQLSAWPRTSPGTGSTPTPASCRSGGSFSLCRAWFLVANGHSSGSPPRATPATRPSTTPRAIPSCACTTTITTSSAPCASATRSSTCPSTWPTTRLVRRSNMVDHSWLFLVVYTYY